MSLSQNTGHISVPEDDRVELGRQLRHGAKFCWGALCAVCFFWAALAAVAMLLGRLRVFRACGCGATCQFSTLRVRVEGRGCRFVMGSGASRYVRLLEWLETNREHLLKHLTLAGLCFSQLTLHFGWAKAFCVFFGSLEF